MRGVAHDPVLRAKLMAQHEAGIPLSVLSEQHGIARPVLSRWWARYDADALAELGAAEPMPPSVADASSGGGAGGDC